MTDVRRRACLVDVLVEECGCVVRRVRMRVVVPMLLSELSVRAF